MMNRRYDILDSLPTYGPMYIPISEYNDKYYSEGFLVRFQTDHGTFWVGNFEPGWTGLNAVYDFDHQTYILVIAGRTCYLMNPNDIKPISIIGCDYQSVVKTLEGRLILQDSTHLSVFESSGEY